MKLATSGGLGVLLASAAIGQSQAGGGGAKASLAELKEQAREVARQFPVLADFLTQRDRAIEATLLELADRIPDPSRLPTIRLPDSPVVELAEPRSESECASILDDSPGFHVPQSLRERLHWLCLHGIYIRNTGFSGLSRS